LDIKNGICKNQPQKLQCANKENLVDMNFKGLILKIGPKSLIVEN
jgi:hypothetical protein